MPWLTVPFQQSSVRAELAQLYGIRGIPTLLLLDNNGHVITMDARTKLAEDPLAQVCPNDSTLHSTAYLYKIIKQIDAIILHLMNSHLRVLNPSYTI